MKNWTIGAFIGAIIIFGWQFVSHALTNIHYGGSKYTPQQDQILQNLSSTLTDDGAYIMPNVPPGSSAHEQEKLNAQMEGRPMAWVLFVRSYENDMVTAMIRGFLVDLLIVFLIIFIITRRGVPGFGNVLLASLATGFLTFLWGPYMMMVWFKMPWEAVQGDFIDSIVAYGLCGLWLGWILNRKTTKV